MNVEFKKRHDYFIGALNRLPGIVALPGERRVLRLGRLLGRDDGLRHQGR